METSRRSITENPSIEREVLGGQEGSREKGDAPHFVSAVDSPVDPLMDGARIWRIEGFSLARYVG
jgi:hypothetical protein